MLQVVEYVDGRTHEQETRRPSVNKKQSRAGSLNLGKESQRYREKIQGELRKGNSFFFFFFFFTLYSSEYYLLLVQPCISRFL